MTDTVSDVIRRRRTCLRMDAEREVDEGVIAELCELATWAPNHHLTQPWRFVVFTGDGRRRLGETMAAALERSGAAPEKVAKATKKYLRAPVMIAVACTHSDEPVRSVEDRDAVAAAVQTFLLAATERGLASFWASFPAPNDTAALALCRLDPEDTLVAGIYLGYPSGTCPPQRRDPAAITWVR